jgi:hypothetical protein
MHSFIANWRTSCVRTGTKNPARAEASVRPMWRSAVRRLSLQKDCRVSLARTGGETDLTKATRSHLGRLGCRSKAKTSWTRNPNLCRDVDACRHRTLATRAYVGLKSRLHEAYFANLLNAKPTTKRSQWPNSRRVNKCVGEVIPSRMILHEESVP